MIRDKKKIIWKLTRVALNDMDFVHQITSCCIRKSKKIQLFLLNCSKSTWSFCQTAESHFKKRNWTRVRIRFPMDNRMILAYDGWLIAKRGASFTSISQYLSGLRMVNMKHGVLSVNLRPEILQTIIKGIANKS